MSKTTHQASHQAGQQDAKSGDSVSNRKAFRCPKAIVIFFLVGSAGLAADLLSKHLVFQSMLSDDALNAKVQAYGRAVERKYNRPAETKEVLPQFQKPFLGKINITLYTNPGIVFGLRLNKAIVATTTVITVLILGGLFVTSPAEAKLMHFSMAIIVAGALGNLYDRLFSVVQPYGYEPILGQVRDFIDCSGLYYPWIFNIADMLLVLGVGILAILWFRQPKPIEAGK